MNRKGLANRNALARLGNLNGLDGESSDKSDKSDKSEFVGVGGTDMDVEEDGVPGIQCLFVRLGRGGRALEIGNWWRRNHRRIS